MHFLENCSLHFMCNWFYTNDWAATVISHISHIQELTMVKFQMNLPQCLLFSEFGTEFLLEQSLALGSSPLLSNAPH